MRILAPHSLNRSNWNFTLVAGFLFLCVFLGSASASALRFDRRQAPSSPAEKPIFKRGLCCSKGSKTSGGSPPSGGSPSSGGIPPSGGSPSSGGGQPTDFGPPLPEDVSVDALKTELITLGTVAGKRSIFYTSLGGGKAQDQVSQWACSAIDPTGTNFVIYRNLFPDAYIATKLANMIGNAGKF